MMDYLFLLPVCFLVLSVVLATRAVKRGTKTKKAVAVQLVSFLVVTLFCFGVPMVAQAADASTAAAAASSANGMGLIAAALSTGHRRHRRRNRRGRRRSRRNRRYL